MSASISALQQPKSKLQEEDPTESRVHTGDKMGDQGIALGPQHSSLDNALF